MSGALYRDMWGERIDKQQQAVAEYVSEQESQDKARQAARALRLEQQRSEAAAAAAAMKSTHMLPMSTTHHAVDSAKYKEQADVRGVVPGFAGHVPRAVHQYGETSVGGLHRPKADEPAQVVQQLEIELAKEKEKLSGLEKFLAVKKQTPLIGS